MKTLIPFLLFMAPLMGFSQLVLPEFMGPEEGTGQENGIVAEPGDQRHGLQKDGDPADQDSAKDQDPEEDAEVEDLKNMMDRLRGTQVSLSPDQLKKLQKHHQPLDQLEKIYLSGPTHLTVNVTPASGAPFQGKVENMTCRLKTSVGFLPVRLHEIVQATRMKDGKRFSLELKGGDYLEGEFTNFLLFLTLADGSERELTDASLTRVQFKDATSK